MSARRPRPPPPPRREATNCLLPQGGRALNVEIVGRPDPIELAVLRQGKNCVAGIDTTRGVQSLLEGTSHRLHIAQLAERSGELGLPVPVLWQRAPHGHDPRHVRPPDDHIMMERKY